ncbi:glucose 1-dehydrogenase [Oenococcus sicerae]|uniref:Glucose 1-dehydrogenase n=1 Tax=Oenococcus sicerae TaxID=2203724 RepID=A0AAJ1VQK7_9LACO|nr:glucose 1-dehydrogenase [Oenococcus sicerae]MDN6900307.1 glucose 1-dehydrogenase [Oenococcus sicerae]QAS69883.1 glucose 1-dehydrogenase [Oenococcus sicerae]
MTDRLENKVAIVTGGNAGIGKAIAADFIAEGAKVVITGRNQEKGDQAVQDIAGDIIFMQQDVSKEADWKKVIDATIDQFGKFDILVNNAGVGGVGKPLAQMSLDEFNWTQSINLAGNFLGIRFALNQMAEPGSVIDISSVAGLRGLPGAADYSASKGGTRLLSKAAALEALQMGKKIRINSVHPGWIDTEIIPDKMREMAVATTPMRHLGQPKDIAKLVTYLASDESEFTTGSEFTADGGQMA